MVPPGGETHRGGCMIAPELRATSIKWKASYLGMYPEEVNVVTRFPPFGQHIIIEAASIIILPVTIMSGFMAQGTQSASNLESLLSGEECLAEKRANIKAKIIKIMAFSRKLAV
ncbi:uncharacterized protein CIMG_13472 [Coccidioides immitis RS]|uniref:Uncharacterized protein n=1 Tax=Coccidioides immitis (strain RS) TaxID=246410 RepID=A0A0D8JV67_COCIM|nr:uncharacterized protein CIMG_13472 [Coccidioides immitis RS]KJF61187.1 hypothetical protein CIMG_13472 [Coccidioides immitis RS]